MNCLVLPVSILRRRYSGSRLGYRPLTEESEDPVTVVVGKEKREFLVDPFVLEESPFRVLIDLAKNEEKGRMFVHGVKRKIFVDVDAILFEHMLWLLHNDSSSLFQLNLTEIIDFYSQEN
ncbi:auxin-responsive protein SAUR76 [Cornus florida]|uniref:auxin-responsive protein SAUR76 n=1 Tax=Cornus florida TaxID=4283 RepID=UPI00289FEB0E|nr:auxin-responsive protein SAUR76 [Cornus florida]